MTHLRQCHLSNGLWGIGWVFPRGDPHQDTRIRGPEPRWRRFEAVCWSGPMLLEPAHSAAGPQIQPGSPIALGATDPDLFRRWKDVPGPIVVRGK